MVPCAFLLCSSCLQQDLAAWFPVHAMLWSSELAGWPIRGVSHDPPFVWRAEKNHPQICLSILLRRFGGALINSQDIDQCTKSCNRHLTLMNSCLGHARSLSAILLGPWQTFVEWLRLRPFQHECRKEKVHRLDSRFLQAHPPKWNDANFAEILAPQTNMKIAE